MNNRVNKLKLYKGDPYKVTDKITIYQPIVDDLIENEDNFWAVIYAFIGNTTMKRLQLWNKGEDWNKISNYELFCRTVKTLTPDVTSFIFKDIDFTTFDVYENPNIKPDEIQLEPNQKKPTHTQKRNLRFHNYEKTHSFYSAKQDIQINASTYHYMSNIFKAMVNIYPKDEYAVGKTSKNFIIQEEEQKLKKRLSEINIDEMESMVQPQISAAVCNPGYPYNIEETFQLKVFQFYDCVGRLQIEETTRALIRGAYSGFVDTSKVNHESFNFARPIRADK